MTFCLSGLIFKGYKKMLAIRNRRLWQGGFYAALTGPGAAAIMNR
jgi:hypothetical protein